MTFRIASLTLDGGQPSAMFTPLVVALLEAAVE
jgi:hypothetical protein